VVDGDTVDATIDLGFDLHSHQRIRLFGINAPETRTRDKQEKKAGLASKARLKELLKQNKNNCIVKTQLDRKGKFGRLLGTLYVDAVMDGNADPVVAVDPVSLKPIETNINELLVMEGHAYEYKP
tara:strand:+ start:431 stop:805 length:375 start_codon:yes stop_codon:yes gene_type:complete